jgi:hypothetical protein
MKCEKLSKTSELLDYLKNNLLVAGHCGFDLAKGLPSYWTFNRYIRKLDNAILKEVMKSQVLELVEMKLIDGSFIGLDSTPNAANTKQNNPKSFMSNKFDKENPPKSDKDCSLGVHTASNQHNDKNYEFYWGYKNHVLSDCITGLPIFEMTTGASTADSAVAVDILEKTHSFLSLKECSFIADAGYDIKEIYNTIRNIYHGDCYIPINPRNTQNPVLLPIGNPICEAGLAMNRNGKSHDNNRTRQQFCCPIRQGKSNVCSINHSKWHKSLKYRGRGCVKSSGLLCLMITDSPSTANPKTSKPFTNSVPSANVTIPASKLPDKNAFGLVISSPLKILTLLLILLCLPLPLPPSNLNQTFLTVPFFPLKGLLSFAHLYLKLYIL